MYYGGNWIRFLDCIAGFEDKYGKWPSSIRLDSIYIKELKENPEEDEFKKLGKNIRLIPDDSYPYDATFIAEDADGNRFDIAKEGHKDNQRKTRMWLKRD